MAAGRIQPSQDPKTDATERVPPLEFTWRATALMAETGSGIQWRAMLCHGRRPHPALSRPQDGRDGARPSTEEINGRHQWRATVPRGRKRIRRPMEGHALSWPQAALSWP